MKVRRFTFCLAAFLINGVAGFADDRSARFVQMMSALPAEVYANRSDFTPQYVDFEAAARVIDALAVAAPGTLDPDAVRFIHGPFEDREGDSGWQRKAGFAFADIRAAGILPDGEEPAMALLLAPEAVPRVQPAFLANDYALTYEDAFPTLWRGIEDSSFDFSLRNKEDPFAYLLPYPSRVAMKGDVLLQTRNLPQLERLYDAGDNAVVNAFARAIDLPDWGDRELVQATVYSDPWLFITSFYVGADVLPVMLPQGVTPYWNNMMVADLSDGTHDLTLMVLLYHSKADADLAAANLGPAIAGAALPSLGGRTLGGVLGPSTATVIGDGPAAAIIAFESAPDLSLSFRAVNTGYARLLTLINSREMSVLGMPPT